MGPVSIFKPRKTFAQPESRNKKLYLEITLKNLGVVMKNQLLSIVGFVLLFSLSACYRMPTDDDYSTNPRTNNPDLTREKAGGAMPGIGY